MADDDPTGTQPPPPPPPPAPSPPGGGGGGDATGDAGDGQPDELGRTQAALSAERKARKRIEDELEKMRRAGMDETERKVAEAKADARREALAEVNQRLLRAEVRARAADRVVDADAAVALLDLADFEIDDDGRIDTKAIDAAVDELVKVKPYLAKPTSDGKSHAPPPQGTRGVPGSPAQPATSDGDTFLRSLRTGGR
jgi:hypothetical protein